VTITFLGTGTSQGVPVIACDCPVCTSLDFRDTRSRSSIHIAFEGQSVVVDTGPDFRFQILRERIKKLDAVLFTHQHRDHTAGLDEIRSFNFKQRSDMPIFASEEVITQLGKDFNYIFAGADYPGLPRIITNVISNQPFKIGTLAILPIQVLHYKLPVFGFRFGDFTYITDANHIPAEEKLKIRGSKTLVLNALQINSHPSHFNLEEALQLVEELEPQTAYFTHISHNLGLHKKIEPTLPPNVHLAYDGLKLHF
jgi:phosphoribosyl 1,2-cyclic phosphate phosphodiesterase